MSANDGLRLVCADILQALALADMWRFVSLDDRRPLGLLEGAGMLRWAERHEYGDPVPADEHQAALDELKDEHERAIEGAVDDVRAEAHGEYRDEISALKEENKRLQLCIDEAREHLSRYG
jgi:hypothetical protein